MIIRNEQDMILKNFKSLLVTMVTFAFGMGIVHAQTINWTGEDYTKNFAGYYYIKCYSGNKFMAANGTNGKLVSGHTKATVFTFDYQKNDTYTNEFNLSYKENNITKYINSNKTSGMWGESPNKWNFNWVESKSGYTFNRRDSYIWLDDTHFTITYNYSKNSIAYAKTNENDDADNARVWQLISEEQVAAVYPTADLATASKIDGLKYKLISTNSYSTEYESASTSVKNMWLVKQHVDNGSTVKSFTISGLNNDNYIVEIYAKKTGAGTAKIIANGVSSDELTTNLALYRIETEAKSNAITVELNTNSSVDVSFAMKSISAEEEIAQRTSITWTPEVVAAGNYYIQHDDASSPKNYLSATNSISAVGTVYDDIENSTLFNISASTNAQFY